MYNWCGFMIFAWCFFMSAQGIETFNKNYEFYESHSSKHQRKISKRELYNIDDSNRWSDYLEEKDHSLYGSNTPIFVAKLNKRINDPKNPSFIEFDQKPFIISDAENIELIVRKRAVPIESLNFSYIHNSDYSHFENFKINHSLYRNNQPKTEGDSFFKIKNYDNRKRKRSISNNQNSDVVYIKILVVIDYDTYELHNKDLVMTATYISALLNGVDLKFRHMSNPRVRLNLAGIVVPEEASALSCFNWYQYREERQLTTDIIIDLMQYFSDIFPKKNYDVIINIARFYKAMSEIHWLKKGKSYKPNNWPTQPALIIVPDNGGLSSTLLITAVLASILGYDSYSETHPCVTWHDYIERNSLFIPDYCIRSMQRSLSVDLIRKKLNKKPNIGKPLSKKLPGKLFNRNHQCKRFNTWIVVLESDENANSNCWELTCKVCDSTLPTWDFICYKYTPSFSYLAEGSSCGVGKICLNGTCIHESEIIN